MLSSREQNSLIVSADIVKMIESQPDLASKLRRVRGGYLKIQGTWMPYEIALRLARRYWSFLFAPTSIILT